MGGLSYARVLVGIGELAEAEREIRQAIDVSPDNWPALSLLAKVKHIRGELSEAVACWTQTHLRYPYHPIARMQLLSMLDLTRDPERGAGEFVAVGQFQLARKPLAYLELDQAFRYFLARRPVEAREHCERVGRRHRSGDRELFKLATLAEALFAELSGDLPGAARILEGLGRERGFESDIDRVTALADLYESIGGRAELEAALNICRYLDRTYPGIHVLGRMAVLHRRLDEPELAERFAAMHLEAFERGMHRVTLDEAAAVAATRYVPLRGLARMRFARGEPSPQAPAMQRALVSAIRGDTGPLQALPTTENGALRRKYAAELALEAGDAARAEAELTVALREDPSDLQLLHLVFGEAPAPPWSAAVLSEGVAAKAEQALQRAAELDPRDPRTFQALSVVAAGSEEERESLVARATGLRAAREQREHAVGRALAAAVYRFVGQTKGLIHEIWAGRERTSAGHGGNLPRDAILGNVTEDMKSAVRSAFVAVREYARATFPHLTEDILDFDYSFRITKDDEPSSGTSAGLPTALAFLSVFLQEPLPQDLAFTGVIVADAHDVLVVRRIGDVESKVKGAYHRDMRSLVLPEENREELLRSHRVPAAVREETCVFVSTLSDAARVALDDRVFR